MELKKENRKAQNVKRIRLLKKHNIEKKENLDQVIEELKQKVSTKMQRLSRYRKRQNQYYQNKLFRTDCKKFCNCLRQTYSNVKNAPDEEKVENFWREIYRKEVQHNGQAHWIENQYQQNPSTEWSPVCEKDVAKALRTTLNWKAPGRDQIANFWLKQLTTIHKHIALLFNKLIEEDQIPEWLTAGVTFLIPKKREYGKSKDLQTCDLSVYNIQTYDIYYKQAYTKYMDDENLMAKEQEGCCSRSKGCKDQMLISKAILQECKRRKKICEWHGLIILSESFRQGATQLDNQIPRVNWDQ